MPTLTDPTATVDAEAPRRTRRRKCRPQDEREAARARIRRERIVPLAALAGQPLDLEGRTCYPTLPVLTRWGVEGRRGVFLDLTRFDRAAGLVTSREAVKRFVAACEAIFWAEYLAARNPTAT